MTDELRYVGHAPGAAPCGYAKPHAEHSWAHVYPVVGEPGKVTGEVLGPPNHCSGEPDYVITQETEDTPGMSSDGA